MHARLDGMPIRRLLALFALELLLLAAVAFWKIPFSYPEGDIALNALDVLRTGHVHSAFLPAIYPFVIAHAYGAAGPAGFVLLQAFFYWGLLLLVAGAVRIATRRPRESLVAAALIALDPDLLSAIPKALDTLATSVLLLSMVCLCLRWLRRQNTALLTVLLLGVAWGLALAVRPNLALMLLPIGYAFLAAGVRPGWLRLIGVVCLALAVLAAANTLAHGSFYLPQNGPYNFFAGANPLTLHALTHGYNAELSIPGAIAPYWPSSLAPAVHPHDYYDSQLNPLYMRSALAFIAAHPLQWLWLAVLKLFTLLRPSLRNHHGPGPFALLEVLTSLCVPAWLALVIYTRKTVRALPAAARTWARHMDRFFYLVVGAYILPFVLTNADPRFRAPLDVIVLTHAAILLIRAWRVSGLQRQRNGGRRRGRQQPGALRLDEVQHVPGKEPQ